MLLQGVDASHHPSSYLCDQGRTLGFLGPQCNIERDYVSCQPHRIVMGVKPDATYEIVESGEHSFNKPD